MGPKIVYWSTTIITAVALALALSYLTGSEQVVSGFDNLDTRSTSGLYLGSPNRPQRSSC